MNLINKTVFFLFLFFGLNVITFATHVVGGELTYVFLDANGPNNAPMRFRVNLSLYIDRGPTSNFPTGVIGDATIRVYNGLGENLNVSQTINSGGRDTTKIQPELPNGCQIAGVKDIKILKNDFEGIINVPASPTGYYFTYFTCCRNLSILNINTSNAGTSFIAFVPSLLYPNSSPQFTDLAVPYMCAGDTTTFVNTAFDPDGDELIYSFADNKSDVLDYNANNLVLPLNIQYRPGFSINNPFGAGGYAYINPSTGLTKYFAPNAGQYVITVQIQEYRKINGQSILLSTITRDIQIVVNTCQITKPPKFITKNIASSAFTIDTTKVINGPTSVFNIETGDSISFCLNAKNPTGDSISLTPSGPILNGSNGYTGSLASFSKINGKDSVKTCFKWKTSCTQNAGTYVINVATKVKGCPPKTSFASYTINVAKYDGPNQIFGKDTICSHLAGINYNYSVTAKVGAKYKWIITNGIIVGSDSGNTVNIKWNNFVSNGSIKVTEKTPFCSGSLTRNIKLLQSGKINLGKDTSICQGTPIQILATGAINYRWTPNIGLSSNFVANPIINPNITTTYIVNQFTQPSCIIPDTINVTIIPRSANAGLDKNYCSGFSTTIGTINNVGFKSIWTPSLGLNDSTIAQPTVSIVNNSSTNITQRYKVKTFSTLQPSCFAVDSVDVTIKAIPAKTPKQRLLLCNIVSDSIGILSSPNMIYDWKPNINISSTNKAKVFYSKITTNIDSTQYLISSTNQISQCSIVDTLKIISITNNAIAGSDQKYCSGDSAKIGNVTNPYFQYLWSPNLSLSSNINANPLVKLTNNDTLVKIENYILAQTSILLPTCISKDTVKITVNPQPKSIAKQYLTICSANNITIGQNQPNSFTYRWLSQKGILDTTTEYQNINIFNNSTPDTILYFRKKNFETCQALDSIQLIVFNTSKVDTIFGNKSVCPGVTDIVYNIKKENGASYQWFTNLALAKTVNLATDSVKVNWGDSTNLAQVSVLMTNQYNCISKDTIKLPVVVKARLKTQTPIGRPEICNNIASNILYQVSSTTNSKYRWTVVGGTFVNGDTTNKVNIKWDTLSGIKKLMINENVVTNMTQCFGQSDTLYVNILPSPKTSLLLIGDSKICKLISDTTTFVKKYKLPLSGNNSSFNWSVVGGNILKGQNKDSLLVRWNTDGFNKISLIETSDKGCVGNIVNYPIKTNTVLSTKITNNDSIICGNFLLNRKYSVRYDTGSVYNWSIVGGTITSNNNNGLISVDWNSTGNHQLIITQTSKDTCISQSVNFKLFFDESSLMFKSLTTNKNIDNQIDVNYKINEAIYVQNPIQLFRRIIIGNDTSNYQFVSTLNKNDTLYFDQNLDTKNKVYQYQIRALNACLQPIISKSRQSHSYQLSVNAIVENNVLDLRWNMPLNKMYSTKIVVYRKLDSQFDFTEYGSFRGDIGKVQISYETGLEAFEHCYRLAIIDSAVNQIYMSNIACATFDNPLGFPTFISPNNDGDNDQFIVKNLHLYLDNKFTIYNRWGKTIYEVSNYSNNNAWEPNSLADGVYYYSFVNNKNNKVNKGWIQVTK